MIKEFEKKIEDKFLFEGGKLVQFLQGQGSTNSWRPATAELAKLVVYLLVGFVIGQILK